MTAARVFAWTAVGLAGAASVAWLVVCAVVPFGPLIWTAGVLVIAAVASLAAKRR